MNDNRGPVRPLRHVVHEVPALRPGHRVDDLLDLIANDLPPLELAHRSLASRQLFGAPYVTAVLALATA